MATYNTQPTYENSYDINPTVVHNDQHEPHMAPVKSTACIIL
jgi:hypothetical protein